LSYNDENWGNDKSPEQDKVQEPNTPVLKYFFVPQQVSYHPFKVTGSHLSLSHSPGRPSSRQTTPHNDDGKCHQ
jgi:hypothetical protein